MSEQMPPAGYRGGDPRAQAKAEKAYRKATRPWYKKKRFIIPAALVLLFVIGGIAGGGSKSEDSSTTEAAGPGASDAPESTSGSSPTSTQVAPAAPTVAYAGSLKDDKLAGGTGAPGAEVALSGWTTTASALANVKSSFGSDSLCSDVTLTNRDKEQQDYNGLSWKLQTPGGNVQDITFTGANDLSSGGLAPGGSVSKTVCFEDQTAGPGQYVLSWTPDIFGDEARGIWLNTL